MQVYIEKNKCTGCRACEQRCPNHCIEMQSDEEGFLYPVVNDQKCVQCETCTRTCSEKVCTEEYKQCAYAAKNKNKVVREHSSSGGVFYELASQVLSEGGIVFGAAFDKTFQVYQKAINNVKDLPELMGSKYVQSDTRNTYMEVQKYLNSGRKVLYSGTPCQIAGLKKYLKRNYNSLICVSVICLGVPSADIWRRYLEYKKGEFYSEKVEKVAFRDKEKSWREYQLNIDFGEAQYVEKFANDLYGKGFIQQLFLRPSCYQCNFKGDNVPADIILGDYWGIEHVHPEFEDRKGTSVVIVKSRKGQYLFECVADKIEVIPSKYIYCEKYNSSVSRSAKYNARRKHFFEELRETNNVAEAIKRNLKLENTQEYRKIYQYPIVMKYLQNKIKGWNICDFFDAYGYKNVVLYAITEITELVKDDILFSDNQLESFSLCDSDAARFANGYSGRPVMDMNKLLEQYQCGEIDCIVICSLFHENEIFYALMQKGIPQSCIISITSIVYSIA